MEEASFTFAASTIRARLVSTSMELLFGARSIAHLLATDIGTFASGFSTRYWTMSLIRPLPSRAPASWLQSADIARSLKPKAVCFGVESVAVKFILGSKFAKVGWRWQLDESIPDHRRKAQRAGRA